MWRMMGVLHTLRTLHAMRGYVSALTLYPCIYERMTSQFPRYLVQGLILSEVPKTTTTFFFLWVEVSVRYTFFLSARAHPHYEHVYRPEMAVSKNIFLTCPWVLYVWGAKSEFFSLIFTIMTLFSNVSVMSL